jgi:hypothetical protein
VIVWKFQIFFLSLQRNKRELMEEKILLDLLYQSMQDSAREARLSLGRPSSSATREEALQQVAMLKAAKESASRVQR